MSRMLKAVVERIGEVEQPIAMPFPSWCQLVVASWGVKVATAWLYSEGMAWDFQAILISFQRSFSTMGQFLYTLWGMPFGPGAKAALFTTRLISDHLGGAVSNLKTGSVRRGTCSGEPSGVFSGSHNWVLVCSSRSCWVAAFCYFSPPVDFYMY